MPFAPVCFWAFQTRGTFWAIFKIFPWSPLCSFKENAGFWWPCKNCHNLAIGALLEPPFCFKIFSSLCPLGAYYLESNAICTSVLLGLSNEVYFLKDFWKSFIGPTFALFKKIRGLSDLAKIVITWTFGHFCIRCLRPNLVQSLHFKCILIRG